MPKLLELFAGTSSVGNVFKSHGWEVYTVDWDKQFDVTLHADIGSLTAEDCIELCGGRPDVIWISFPCETYSVAAMGHHRRKNQETGELDPITDAARESDTRNKHVMRVLEELSPRYFFIENPRAGLRTMRFMLDREREGFMVRYTTTYCQYGESRMKPTDLWTNHPNPRIKPPCRYGDPCHERAPRGSKCGTQAIKGARDRARIPVRLCEHVYTICQEGME